MQHQFFHFQITLNNQVLIDSQDRVGFKGFVLKFIAANTAMRTMSKQAPEATEAHVFAVTYSDLPPDHTAIRLMADYELSHTGEYDDNDYSKLHVTTEQINQ